MRGATANQLVNLLNDIEDAQEYNKDHVAKAEQILAKHKRRDLNFDDEEALLV